MRIHKLIIAISACFIFCQTMAQTKETEPAKYRKFAVYAGVGPSYFFNNLVSFKDDVNPFNYSFSLRVMWEPEHSFVSLGIETGYFLLYTVNTSQPKAHVANSSIPLQLCVSMKFSKKVYANWSMGQGFLSSKVDASGSTDNFNSSSVSLADFTATIGYRFIQKTRISYAAELKGYYSSGYNNGTIAALFIVGYRL